MGRAVAEMKMRGQGGELAKVVEESGSLARKEASHGDYGNTCPLAKGLLA